MHFDSVVEAKLESQPVNNCARNARPQKRGIHAAFSGKKPIGTKSTTGSSPAPTSSPSTDHHYCKTPSSCICRPHILSYLLIFKSSRMALPVVRDVLECANYSSTVAPYFYQLRPLPQIFFEHATNPTALKQVYLDTNPLASAFAFSLALGPIFLVASEINKNYSQVDRFWSILPTVYNVHYTVWAHLAGYNTGRLDLLCIASLLWSVSIHLSNRDLG